VELLKRYKEEIGNDLIINDFNIKDVQLKLPSRKHFWVARLIDAKIEHGRLLKKRKLLKTALVKKIMQESPVKLTVTTAESAADSTDEIQTINDSIKEYDYIIEYLEKVEKIMSSMHWEIKNIVELNRLEQL
jgi:hypothetical protein